MRNKREERKKGERQFDNLRGSSMWVTTQFWQIPSGTQEEFHLICKQPGFLCPFTFEPDIQPRPDQSGRQSTLYLSAAALCCHGRQWRRPPDPPGPNPRAVASSRLGLGEAEPLVPSLSIRRRDAAGAGGGEAVHLREAAEPPRPKTLPILPLRGSSPRGHSPSPRGLGNGNPPSSNATVRPRTGPGRPGPGGRAASIQPSYLLLNFSGCFSLIRWNLCAIEAS
jgi:hypothetical protein